MQAIGRQPQRVPDGAPVRYERHRPEQSTLDRLMQQHAASFIAHTEASTGGELPRFVKDEFDAFRECSILTHGCQRLRCGECGHDKLLAFSCKRRGFCPSCGARRMSQTAAHLVDQVIPHVPVRQWVLSLPIPLRLLLAAQPELVTPVLQVVQRLVTRHLLDRAGLKADEGHGGAVTLIQRFGGAANLNTHLHCLVLDGEYRCDAEGVPASTGAAGTRGARAGHEVAVADECEVETAQARPHRIGGARLLKRVFDIDMPHCPNCGAGELKIIAAILERPVIEKILTHLGMDPQPPPRGRAREPGQDRSCLSRGAAPAFTSTSLKAALAAAVGMMLRSMPA